MEVEASVEMDSSLIASLSLNFKQVPPAAVPAFLDCVFSSTGVSPSAILNYSSSNSLFVWRTRQMGIRYLVLTIATILFHWWLGFVIYQRILAYVRHKIILHCTYLWGECLFH